MGASTPRTRAVTRFLRWATVVATLTLPRVAPGTIAEQRARLPPPAHCADPVAGIWRSHSYNPDHGDWTIFSLEVRRRSGEPLVLTGSIKNESWEGTPKQSEPTPCRGQMHYVVSMTGAGRYDNGFIEFRGLEWHMDQAICGIKPSFGYNLDVFTGTIDSELQEFQAKNNDGGVDIDTPYVFRRVRCFDDEPPARLDVAVPPIFPEEGRGGCLGL